jgi:hypothetical protein
VYAWRYQFDVPKMTRTLASPAAAGLASQSGIDYSKLWVHKPHIDRKPVFIISIGCDDPGDTHVPIFLWRNQTEFYPCDSLGSTQLFHCYLSGCFWDKGFVAHQGLSPSSMMHNVMFIKGNTDVSPVHLCTGTLGPSLFAMKVMEWHETEELESNFPDIENYCADAKSIPKFKPSVAASA